jgi:starch synthase
MASSEVGRIKSAGGMADAVLGLAQALAKLGHRMTVITPCYAGSLDYCLDEAYLMRKDVTLNVSMGAMGTVNARVHMVRLPVVSENPLYMTAYLIGDQDLKLFGKHDIYKYDDDPVRFLFFDRAVLELYKKKSSQLNEPELKGRRSRIIDRIPQIIHTHDWPTGFIPYYFRHVEKNIRVALVHNIHNLGYGIEKGFPLKEDRNIFYELTGETNPWVYSPDGMKLHDKIDQTKTAIVFADKIVTVSPSYAQEILEGKSPPPADKYQGILQARRPDVHGILNGLPDDFGPQKFAREGRYPLRAAYSPEDLSGKRECRRQLQQTLGLEPDENASILAFSGRWVEQKGIDVIINNIGLLMKLPIQLVIIGSGDPGIFQAITGLNELYPGRFRAKEFDRIDGESLETLYLAGADAVIMPSRFEPCGLVQMKAQKFGTLPIVNGTGGLRDTVKDGEDGFVIDGVTPESIFGGIDRAITLHHSDRSRWEEMMRNAMRHDYSWIAAAQRYVDLVYREAVARAFRQSMP